MFFQWWKWASISIPITFTVWKKKYLSMILYCHTRMNSPFNMSLLCVVLIWSAWNIMHLNSTAKFQQWHHYSCSIVKQMLHVIFVVLSLSVTSFGQESLKGHVRCQSAVEQHIPESFWRNSTGAFSCLCVCQHTAPHSSSDPLRWVEEEMDKATLLACD